MRDAGLLLIQPHEWECRRQSQESGGGYFVTSHLGSVKLIARGAGRLALTPEGPAAAKRVTRKPQVIFNTSRKIAERRDDSREAGPADNAGMGTDGP